METAETVIIGGGIVGCAAAYYLAARGVRPVVLERRGIAAEASGANAGMVGAASGVPGKTLAHTKKSLELMVSAALELGRPVELVREGRLTLACSDVEWPEVEEFAASRRREGIAVEVVLPDGLRRLEPGLGAHVAGAAFVPGDGHVNPILLTLAYAAAARRLGAEI